MFWLGNPFLIEWRPSNSSEGGLLEWLEWRESKQKCILLINRMNWFLLKWDGIYNKNVDRFDWLLILDVFGDPFDGMRHSMVNTRLSALSAPETGWCDAGQSPSAVRVDDQRTAWVTLKQNRRSINDSNSVRDGRSHNTGVFASVLIPGAHHLWEYP